MTQKHILAGAVALGAMALANPVLIKADVADDIRYYLEEGEFDTASQMLALALEDTENSSIAGKLYQLEGEIQYNSPGQRRASHLAFMEARQRGIPEASLYLGRLAMLDYNFPEAQKLFGEYSERMKKAKRQLDPDFTFDTADLEEGKRQFARMQEIVVIDAVKVPKKEFFKHLRLPLSAGRVVATSELPLTAGVERGPAGYISESGELMMWSELNDSTGMLGLMEASKLIDGTLSEPHPAPDFLAQEGDAINPFLSADGTTLYYAANGDNSVGGFDIFLATRDPLTGEYLQPVNAGIPFNSAADEYVMAIDEENGVGWWATDRHYLPDDQITLYVYVLPEARVNLDTDDEEKRLRARLDDIRLTWTPVATSAETEDEESDEDEETATATEHRESGEELAKRYSALASEIRKIEPGQKPGRRDCVIPLGKGKYIYSADDVRGAEEKRLVEEYIAAEKRYQSDRARLSQLRREWAAQDSRGASLEISSLEESVESQRRAITTLLSNLYRLLKK